MTQDRPDSRQTNDNAGAAGYDRGSDIDRAAELFQQSGDAVFIADLEGIIVDVNEEVERLYGWTREDLVGGALRVIIPERRYAQGDDLWARCLDGQAVRNVETERCNKCGDLVPVRLTLGLIRGVRDQPIGVFCTTHDLSALKHAESRLRRMTKVFMDSQTPMSILDLYGRVLDANPASERLLGWTREERLGQTPLAARVPEMRDLLLSTIERVVGGRAIADLEIESRTKDGHELILLVGMSRLTDENEEPIGIAVVAKDITELRRTTRELQRTSVELARSNRELEEYALVMSHDLQQPLRSIVGFGDLLRECLGAEIADEARGYLESMCACAEQLRLLIRDLLSYARLGSNDERSADIDLGICCDAAVEQLGGIIGETDALVTRDELPHIEGHAGHMTLLFQNLIGNALKYRSARKPEVRITAERVGDTWQISIADNGIGIDPKASELIFEAFHRLHSYERVPGTGIGLALCRKIVERHDGRIWVESTPNKGSTFRFTIAD